MSAGYINPVCYNGLSKPNRDAVNFGPVSLGTVSQDYTTLTSNDWRAGINPSTNTVIYTDTYSRGVDSQAAAVPSIHWISGQSQANIIELISRLPERAADNYEIFASYADAINWLINTQGTYMLVNTKYPEYLLDAECAVNLELGFLASYPGIDQYVYDLVSGGSQNIFSANGGSFSAPSDGSFVGYFRAVGGGTLSTNTLKNAAGGSFALALVVEGVFYQNGGDGVGNYLVGTQTDTISVIVTGPGNIEIKSGAFTWSWTGVGVLASTGIFHIAAHIPTGSMEPGQATLYINGSVVSGAVLTGTGSLANTTIPDLTLCQSIANGSYSTATRVYGFKVYGYSTQENATGALTYLPSANYAAISTIYGI